MREEGPDTTRVDDASTRSVVERLTIAQRHAAHGLARALAEDDCTVDQWLVLRALADAGGHRMGGLAATLLIPRPTLTRVVDALSDRALVYRRQLEEDGRRVAVHLSRQGRVRLARLDALVRAHEDGLRSDAEWQRLLADLLRVADASSTGR